MFSVRYEVFEAIDRLFNIFRSQNDVLLVLYLFVWRCAKAISLEFYMFIDIAICFQNVLKTNAECCVCFIIPYENFL